MNRSLPLAALAVASGILLAGCATRDMGAAGRPQAYHDTRLQYAILTDDRETLKNEFRVNPDRSDLERGLTGLTLPFAAALETVFYPAFYALTESTAPAPGAGRH